MKTFDVAGRARAAGIHLLISVVVALLVGGLLFKLWYPGPFRSLARGQNLYFLLVSVDICLGPLLTFTVFDSRKRRWELRLDLAIIGIVQAAALVYGIHTVYIARPVAVVYEVDRFRLVTATDISEADLAQARPEYHELPRFGPLLLGTRTPSNGAENNEALFTALKGRDIGSRPQFWRPYPESIALALSRSRSVVELLTHYASDADQIRQSLHSMDIQEAQARFIPVVARDDWVAILNPGGNVVGYLPVDGFF